MKHLRPSFLLVILLAAFGAPTLGVAAEGWFTSLQAARTEAERTNKLIFVDLYADWCGWCKELEEKVFTTREFRQWANKEVVLLRVDTEDGSEGTMLYRRYGGGSLPTTLVLTPELGVVARIQGFLPAPKFLAQLQEDVGSWKRLEREFPAVIAGTDVTQQQKLAEALHGREDGHRAALLYRRIIEVSNPNPIKRAELLTRLADAHRVAAEYPEALAALDQAGPHLKAAGEAIAARAELLRSEIAHEKGDCAAAKSGLTQFLLARPTSTLARPAQRLLDYIEGGHSPACA